MCVCVRVCTCKGGGTGVCQCFHLSLSHTLNSHATESPSPIIPQNCVYDPFALTMKKSSKPGMGDKFQLAIVGDYPTRWVGGRDQYFFIYTYICISAGVDACKSHTRPLTPPQTSPSPLKNKQHPAEADGEADLRRGGRAGCLPHGQHPLQERACWIVGWMDGSIN